MNHKTVARWVLFLTLALMSFPCRAQEEWLGIYLQGKKIGYSRSVKSEGGLDGAPGTNTESLNVMNVEMLGATMQMRIESKSWFDAKNQPVRMTFVTESAGRKSVVTANFTQKEIAAESEMGGRVTKKTIAIPAGVRVMDDPMMDLMAGAIPKPGSSYEVYVFDPNTVDLIKNVITFDGPCKVEVGGTKTDAQKVSIKDPRAPLTAYLSAKGDLIRVDGPLGLMMAPEPKERAMDMSAKAGEGPIDLATASAIPTDRPIKDPYKIRSLKLRIDGFDMSRVPSDEHQTVRPSKGGWEVTVHPVRPSANRGTTIRKAARNMKRWTQPDVRIPCDKPRFKKLAAGIVGNTTNVVDAAEKVRLYVHAKVRGNAGIGVLRDADDILDTAEGVCRDHAVLCATLMRAAGIPTRMVSGMVYAGRFYYHAWVEVWNGEKWVGFDSTRPGRQLTATHIKVAQGTVSQALSSFVLDGAKFKVLQERN